jgi:acetyltransferase-like isoleucine patch superfamily enzyme
METAPHQKPRRERFWSGALSRLYQLAARIGPGAQTLRVRLHRARGVKIGRNVWIGYDVVLDTSRPELITIEDGASIGMRVTIIAHFRETSGVRIEKDAFIGPSVTILPGVVVGEGAVVTAGSVVTRSIPAMMFAQGNPAVPIARCGVALTPGISVKEFSRKLKALPNSPKDSVHK